VNQLANSNIACRLDRMASQMPTATAVITAKRHRRRYDYSRQTFDALAEDANRLARGFATMGIGAGQRIALMVRPGADFVALTFALFKTGATIVLIDPGMGRSNLIDCLTDVRPDGFVAIPLVHLVRRLYRRRFRCAKRNVVVASSWAGRAPTIDQVRKLASGQPITRQVSNDDEAAIIFTTGSTGPPKGVLYTHGTFNAQVDHIRDQYEIEPGGTDLAGFPLFGLFNAAMGMTTVVPDMDPTRPAAVDPRRFVAHIHDLEISQSFASPAVWNAVGQYCHDQGVKLPSLRRVLSAGAPVPPHVLKWMKACQPADGEMHTPYGATEALPVATISASEVLNETAALSAQGKGTCVGRRFERLDWRVIRINDEPIATIEETEPVGPRQIGELIVRGPQVTRCYVTSESATRLHKIADGLTFWHRMGDVGYLDDQDRFWFCGRKAHRVETSQRTMYSVPCEAIFNEHAGVYRSALVGVGQRGRQVPAMICEPWPEQWPRSQTEKQTLVSELAQLAAQSPITAQIEASRILLKRSLPVDIRHNAKIFREQLVGWAAKRIG
jgi:acyl-CoA synthetase (AMP-forming)/AMP-acid ligase II